jgi:hypothetical protein
MRATFPAVLIAVTAAAVACGGDDSEPVDPAVKAATVGTYTLTTGNGAPLPFKYYQSDTSRFDIDSGKIVLEANGDMRDEQTTAETRLSDGTLIGVEETQRYLGLWAIRGDSVRLVYPGLGVKMAGRTATSLTLTDGTITLVYTK